MDYEKEYKAAIGRARNLHKDAIDMEDSLRAKMAEIIFPELKESEDERIRKEILDYFRAMKQQGCFPSKHKEQYDSWIVWLEKQGEKVISKNVDEAALQYVDTCHVDGEITYDNITEPYWNNHSMMNAYKAGWLEKQSEQEESQVYDTDGEIITHPEIDGYKLYQPKFHEGEYIVDVCGYLWRVVEIINQFYILEDIDGSESRPAIEIERVNNTSHLWTIQDAEDGDVLVSRSPFIYGKQCSYGGLDWHNNHFIKASNFIFTDSPVHPATKEQRDLLFSKMKEAGYEWDAENKQLIKV